VQWLNVSCFSGAGCVQIIVPGLLKLSQSISAHFRWLSQLSIVLKRAETKQLVSFAPQSTYRTGVLVSAFLTLSGFSQPVIKIVIDSRPKKATCRNFISIPEHRLKHTK
jgi:hypothetical protein